MKAFRALTALVCAWMIALPVAAQQVPDGAYRADGSRAQTNPVAVWGLDSVTSAPCVVGGTPTCELPGGGGGGGGGTSSLSPFAPDSGSNRVDLSVTSSTAATALPATAGGTLEITNQASCVVYLKFGTSGVTAATSDSPIWPGMTIPWSPGLNTHIAGITGSCSGIVTILRGSGSGYTAIASSLNSASQIANTSNVPIDPATSGNQTTANTSLSSIDTKLSSQATAANQTTANTSLSSIDTKSGETHAATAASVPSKADLAGCRAMTALPTAVTNGQLAGAACNKDGILIAAPFGPRETISASGLITLTSTTTETTLIAAGGASVFLDMVSIKVCNTSASDARVDVRDVTAGTVLDSWWAAAGRCVGEIFPASLPQTTANSAWTVQSSASVADLRVKATFVKRQ
jgi:hypothetical protein